MGALNFGDLPERAVLLVDTAPVVYIIEGHPEFGPICKPLFERHGAGHFRFAVTTITLAEVLTGRWAPRTKGSRSAIAQP